MAFKLDAFQEEAISYIQKNENVLVTAKTGSGKTLIGEYQIKQSLAKNKRVFYTTPIKSLSNQKFHDLKKEYENVGIMTGDIKFCPQADVVIMTTEILLNLLYKKGVSADLNLSLENVDAIVFDEVHYINDKDRGHVWEECFVLIPPEINLVLLSATIDSPEAFVGWLTHIKNKPCHLISTQYRVVPLVHMTEDGTVILDSHDVFYAQNYKNYLRKHKADLFEHEKHKERVKYRDGEVVEKTVRITSFIDRMNKLISRIENPVLFFVFSRAKCETYAHKVTNDFLTSCETSDIKHIINFHLRKHPEIQTMETYHQLFSLLQKGIAFHHSGMLPILKEIVEILFSKGFIKVLFATETFAVGINMPTKSVVFTSYRKFTDEADRVLTTSEYIQMAGRAGRRGKDVKGDVYYLPIHEPEDMETVKSMMTGKTATIESQLKIDYKYVLSSINSKTDVLWESYLNTQMQEERTILYREHYSISSMLPSVLHYEQFVRKDGILSKIADSTNSDKRKYQIELSKWVNSHMGPIWQTEWKKYLELKKMHEKMRIIEHKIENLNHIDRQYTECLNFLVKHGFVVNGELTTKGKLACEIHEADSILLAELYSNGYFKNPEINAEDILAILSCFVEGEIIPQDLEYIKELTEIQQKFNLNILSTSWIDPTYKWVDGNNYVCEEYDISHGDFVKAMLKISNILRELINIATISQDTELIEKMKDSEQKIVRSFVIPDSLYLHL